MAETVQSYPGLYPLGSGQLVSLLDGNVLSSIALNTRDLYTPGASDFIISGPGSQVWYAGYSIRVSRPNPFPAPADPLGLTLRLDGSYDTSIPFTFGTEEQLILPVYEGVHHYAGRARVESPVVQYTLLNLTGNTLEVSFQFWGKAL